jgi:hypothetical protein
MILGFGNMIKGKCKLNDNHCPRIAGRRNKKAEQKSPALEII